MLERTCIHTNRNQEGVDDDDADENTHHLTIMFLVDIVISSRSLSEHFTDKIIITLIDVVRNGDITH
jgi:hypothetical protein